MFTSISQMKKSVLELYCTVLYCTVLYCTVLYCTVLTSISQMEERVLELHLSVCSGRADSAEPSPGPPPGTPGE